MAKAVADYVGTLLKSIDRTVGPGLPPVPAYTKSTAHSAPLALRVMIVSEVRLYREGLARALAAHSELEVVENAPGDGLLRLHACHPNIVLADSAIVRTTELAARAADNGVSVVAFAVAEEDEDEVLACAKVGVAGFVARNATMEELLTTLRTASRGEVRCSPRVAKLLVRRLTVLADSSSGQPENLTLTRRQRDIVALIDRGLSNKEIATRLGIEVATVKNHVHYLLKKLQVHRRSEAAAVVRGCSRLRTRNFGPLDSESRVRRASDPIQSMDHFLAPLVHSHSPRKGSS